MAIIFYIYKFWYKISNLIVLKAKIVIVCALLHGIRFNSINLSYITAVGSFCTMNYYI